MHAPSTLKAWLLYRTKRNIQSTEHSKIRIIFSGTRPSLTLSSKTEPNDDIQSHRMILIFSFLSCFISSARFYTLTNLFRTRYSQLQFHIHDAVRPSKLIFHWYDVVYHSISLLEIKMLSSKNTASLIWNHNIEFLVNWSLMFSTTI